MGMCKAMLQRYFYNPQTKTCDEFFYGKIYWDYNENIPH